MLEWPDDDEGSLWDVYRFTDFEAKSVTLWEKDVTSGEGTNTLTFPIPGDSKRFFTVIRAPFEGGFPSFPD
ncbi:hypothetical protein [Haloferula sp.]|uniref:hypothetical protein n=1 Tax=Haloferula sp. TaxID=2497595 RepID=UPI00329B99B3